MKDAQMIKIEYVKPATLKPYKNNAKLHPAEQIEQIKASIQRFGFNDPIAVWKGNEVIAGHGRLMAAQELGLETVPIIRLNKMTDEERKAYALAHNQTTMTSGFDPDLLALELDDILDIDMTAFGFDDPKGSLFDGFEDEDDGYYGDARERSFNATNFKLWDGGRTEGRYGFPRLEPVDYIPERLIGFNYAKSSTDFDACVHFYIDDYQFERVWNDPETYANILARFDACMTPNYSIYLDMPEAIKIWNTYRARLLGQFLQDRGLTVIPIVYWSDERSYEWCFDGIPEESTISVDNIRDKTSRSKELWDKGMQELIDRKNPSRILLYGNGAKEDFDFGDIEVIPYKNEVTERMKGSKNV